ncbi:MAG: BTAD domain-containing putative transcriptional regulator [Solirubrobacteraceae bacterium]
MQFGLLGPIQVLGDGAPLSLGQPKQRVLLASLLLRRGRFASREELIEAIWGQRPPHSAVGSLHVYVHGLRRLLGAERIESRGTAYRIRVGPRELDLDGFEELVNQGRRDLDAGDPERAARVVEEALGLWRGPALGDLPTETLTAERAHLEELRLSALELQIDIDLVRDKLERVLAQVWTLIAEHPYRERLREQQILGLYRAGRQKDALEAYQRARGVLVEELGIEPGPRLRELERAILRQEPGLAPLTRGPAPMDGPATPAREVLLPSPPTRLIGRERELADVEALFVHEAARLVTLTGPGGTGKTRLALAIAQRLADRMADGARFIDLSAAPDPELLLPMIAGELDTPEGHSPLESIAAQLRPLRTLLVLDNLEHLLPAAAAISDLLSAAPRLLILVTSRVRLRLRAEHEYLVPPLSPPQPDARFEDISRSDAVQLLVERTRAVNRSHELTESTAPAFARICVRLDGLPLALELAASRMRTFGPEEVATSLDRALELLVGGPRDLPARQQTLRATIEWSYDQLGETEQRLFARLATFAGYFYLEDVVALCGEESREPLASLVEVNLLRRAEHGGFTMFQTIREYANEQLEQTGESDAMRHRHCGHFLALAERAYAAILNGDDPAAAFRSLERSYDNFREALSWAAHAREIEFEVRLACALRQFWLVRGHLAEGRTFFERAVAATESADRRLRAQALMNGGPFLYRQGELGLARVWWEEALALLTADGDVAGAARCAGELGAVAFSEGDLERSAALYARAADGFAALGDRMRLGIVRANQGEVAGMQGQLPAAIEHAQEAVDMAREVHDADGLALALHTLGRLVQRAGDSDRARQVFSECLIQSRDLDYREILANCVQAAAELTLADSDEPELAARLQSIALHALDRIGVQLQGLEAESFERTAQALATRVGAERLRDITSDTTDVALESVLDETLSLLRPDPSPPASVEDKHG